MTVPWRAIAAPDRVEPVLAEIAANLRRRVREDALPVGLLDGRAGLALFFLYFARTTGSPADRQFAEALVSDLFESLPDEMAIDLAAGLSGVAWLLRHAASTGLLDVDADAALGDIDPQLADQMAVEMDHGRWDYLHGALGCALYLLDAGDTPGPRSALARTVCDLERLGVVRDGPARWRNPLLEDYGPGEAVHPGLAHGISSIAALAARFVSSGIETARARAVLEQAVRCVEGGQADRGMSWCRGHMGVALTLWQAGLAAGRDQWADSAIAILQREAARRDPADTHVNNACVCHGSAGLALMFARMLHRTGHETFRTAAEFWLDETLAMPRSSDDDPSLLLGEAGTGLVLMALTTPHEPAWDRALLIS